MSEKALLLSTGIPEEAIQVRDVYINADNNPGSEENFIHEIRIKGARENLPKLLMVHGFMAGGAYFYKMFKHLHEHFEVIAIDTLGQGCSGRPTLSPLAFEDHASTVAFFVKKIELYLRVGFSESDKFYLLGHSMGGIFASHFTLAHPDRILKLILLSPVGISECGLNE